MIDVRKMQYKMADVTEELADAVKERDALREELAACRESKEAAIASRDWMAEVLRPFAEAWKNRTRCDNVPERVSQDSYHNAAAVIASHDAGAGGC